MPGYVSDLRSVGARLADWAWLAGWLFGWLVVPVWAWLAGWLADSWLTGWLAAWMLLQSLLIILLPLIHTSMQNKLNFLPAEIGRAGGG